MGFAFGNKKNICEKQTCIHKKADKYKNKSSKLGDSDMPHCTKSVYTSCPQTELKAVITFPQKYL